jgi:hypothetical protein
LIYLKIFYEFIIGLEMYKNAWRETIKKFNIFYPMMCLMACVMITIIAMWDLFTGMWSWRTKLVDYKLPGIKFYYVLLVSRLVQRLLACILITLLVPVIQTWLVTSSKEVKEHIVSLMPWQLFHTGQRAIVTMSINEFPFGFMSGLILIFKAWLVVLAINIANGSIFPRVEFPRYDAEDVVEKKTFSYGPEDPGQKLMVTGLTYPPTEYPQKAELVRGRVMERFRSLLEPSNNVAATDVVGTSSLRGIEGHIPRVNITHDHPSYGDDGDEVIVDGVNLVDNGRDSPPMTNGQDTNESTTVTAGSDTGNIDTITTTGDTAVTIDSTTAGSNTAMDTVGSTTADNETTIDTIGITTGNVLDEEPSPCDEYNEGLRHRASTTTTTTTTTNVDSY